MEPKEDNISIQKTQPLESNPAKVKTKMFIPTYDTIGFAKESNSQTLARVEKWINDNHVEIISIHSVPSVKPQGLDYSGPMVTWYIFYK